MSIQDIDQPRRPYSIDLSLELEHQLNNESLPPTPAPLTNNQKTTASGSCDDDIDHRNRPQSMDQYVLASIIRGLNATVADVTKERDELREQLAKSESGKTGAENSLLQFSTRCKQMEQELEEARTKMKDDEHSISMLRTKVEESRRGLMRLQTENRRMSQASSLSVDTPRSGLTPFTAPSSNKRASFISLTNASRVNGHNRISSTSDSNFLLLPSVGASDNNPVSPNPHAQTDYLPDPSSSHPPISSRRFSSVFGRTSSPESYDLPHKDSHVEEMEVLRREMQTIKAELEDTRHELSEANEAREASETCAKALRDFIAETQPSASESGPVRLPPMPTMTTGEEADTTRPASGWGAFRMWKMEPAVKPDPSDTTSSVGTRSMWKVDTTVKHAPTGSSSSSPSSRVTPVAAPFTTKIGGFFTSKTSISSTASSNRPVPQYIPRQPSYNGSDTSSTQDSVVEPISPVNELPVAPVMVHGTSASSSIDLGLPDDVKTLHEPFVAAESILPIARS